MAQIYSLYYVFAWYFTTTQDNDSAFHGLEKEIGSVTYAIVSCFTFALYFVSIHCIHWRALFEFIYEKRLITDLTL